MLLEMEELGRLVTSQTRYVVTIVALMLGIGAVSFGATTLLQPVQNANAVGYLVDPDGSRATIHIGKAGAFSFVAGHTHEVTGPIESGTVQVDSDDPLRSSIHLEIATSALSVSAAGEPQGDAPKVQETMASDQVLDVADYPRITFESTTVGLKARSGNLLDLSVTGKLSIRDASQSITVPVRVQLTDNALLATSRFTIKQSAFGIKPISVGGVVAVKDSLEIEFSISAHARTSRFD
jgi:polyisoprenoid-binding protein YceI